MTSAFFLAFAAGLGTLAWIAAGFVASQPLALAVTVLIAAAYGVGAAELRRFRALSAGLARALDHLTTPPASLAAWLAHVPAPLRDAVRRRVEGERVALPEPALAPYLVGLLVMLGMLGTFLGLIVTLDGAVLALDGDSDLAAIRTALAAPIRGLGQSFGTSVAGVAASASLGLMLAICRRERRAVLQALDAHSGGDLRRFHLALQRQQTLDALQQQGRALPALVEHLQGFMQQLERQHQQSVAQLAQQQAGFHADTHAAYRELAQSVAAGLRDTLAQALQGASAGIQPRFDAALASMAAQAQATHTHLVQTTETQLQTHWQRFGEHTAELAQGWRTAVAAQQQQADALLQGVARGLQTLQREQAQASAALLQATESQLQTHWQRVGAHTAELAQGWRAAVAAQQEQADALLQGVARSLQAQQHAQAEAHAALLQRLQERDAAERNEQAQREHALVAERAQLLQATEQALARLAQGAQAQQQAVATLVETATATLEQTRTALAERLDADAQRQGELAAQLGASALDIASLGEALGAGVRAFGDSNAALVAHLQRLEAALAQTLARSDEQLAYYVAQAREIIELSLSAHKDLVDAVHTATPAAPPAPNAPSATGAGGLA